MEGFTIDGQTFEPCMVLYHSKCIKVGQPFRTRHYGKDTRGVQYPPHATNFPFICELCSTRTQLGRELDPLNVKDTMLLMLERMRMIDTAHAHAVRTTNQMSNILKLVDRFFSGYGLPSIHKQLMLPIIQHPPKNLAITMFWSIALRTAIPSGHMQSNPISWNTARNQRSAISFYRTWWAKVCQPNTMYKDSDRRLLSDDNIGPTDNILSTCTARGMASRLGTESRPSFALNQRHIHWNQLARVRLLDLDLTLEEKYDCVAAQCAELIFWLGWLRSKETFTLRVEDVELTSPKDYGKYGLPKGVGVILLRLLPTTKTQRDKQADMVIAWKTSSGFHLGYWMGELFNILKELKWYSPTCFLFRNKENIPWHSHFFRHRHLYPLLTAQLEAGDINLKHLPLTIDAGLSYYIYSMHSYRHGSQSHCKRKRDGCTRAAHPHEKIEHGRWRVKNQGGEIMPVHYTQATIEDRIYITLLCF